MTAPYKLRAPHKDDLPAIVAFEIEIARISFPDDPVVDPEVHGKKLAKALERDREGMFVAEDTSTDKLVGWLWVALNTNFLTGEQYATFRSLATTHGPDSAEIADRLFERGIEYARIKGVAEITGKVHVNNKAMRVIYKKFGFEAEHLTMKKSFDDEGRRTKDEGRRTNDIPSLPPVFRLSSFALRRPGGQRMINRHVLYDAWVEDPSILATAEPMKALLCRAAEAGGATVLHVHFHQFQPDGVTGFLLLAESHISVHTWVAEGFAAFDIFTCGHMNTDKVLEVIRDGIKPRYASVRRIVRGGDSGPGLSNSPT